MYRISLFSLVKQFTFWWHKRCSHTSTVLRSDSWQSEIMKPLRIKASLWVKSIFRTNCKTDSTIRLWSVLSGYSICCAVALKKRKMWLNSFTLKHQSNKYRNYTKVTVNSFVSLLSVLVYYPAAVWTSVFIHLMHTLHSNGQFVHPCVFILSVVLA